MTVLPAAVVACVLAFGAAYLVREETGRPAEPRAAAAKVAASSTEDGRAPRLALGRAASLPAAPPRASRPRSSHRAPRTVRVRRAAAPARLAFPPAPASFAPAGKVGRPAPAPPAPAPAPAPVPRPAPVAKAAPAPKPAPPFDSNQTFDSSG